MAQPQTVPIRVKVVGGVTANLQAAVGVPLGSAILFTQQTPLVPLEQIGKIYYEDTPSWVIPPRTSVKATDANKTFVIEATPFPVGASIENLPVAEQAIPYNFKVQTKKDQGGGFPSGVRVVGASGQQLDSKLTEQGHDYDIAFTPDGEGEVEVFVTFTVTASVKVSVCAMIADPLQCVAYGPGLEGGEQYKPGVFTVEARNKLGQPIKRGGFPINAKVKGPFGEDIPIDVVDNGDGTFTATYVPVYPGDHIVDVKLGDKPIKDAPFKVPIQYSSETAHAGNSYAEGPGLESGKNKTNQRFPSTFKIFAVGADGKRKTKGGDLFDVVIEDPLFDRVPTTIKDNGDGTYDVSYNAKEPGINVVDIFLRNKLKPLTYEHIKNSPVKVDVKAGTDPSKCTAEGPGLHDGITDTFPAVFKVQARDRDGKPITEGGDPFICKVKDPKGNDVPAEIKDNGDGTYDVVYHPDVPGPHVVDVTLDDQHIKDMPKTVNIKAGISHIHSFIESYTFIVRTCDKRGTPLTTGGQNVKTTCTHNGAPVKLDQQDKGDGTYVCHYSLPEKTNAVYEICTTVEDKPIKGCPMQQKV